jgi:hypothetical protein
LQWHGVRIFLPARKFAEILTVTTTGGFVAWIEVYADGEAKVQLEVIRKHGGVPAALN